MLVPLSLLLAAQAAAPRPAAPVPAAAVAADNAELTRIFDADQADRDAPPGRPIDWDKVVPADDARRARVHAMLISGQVRTGIDYWHAAFVYQHGDAPEDYLLAHTLAVTAVAKGYADAGWIAAATLDRYLGAVGQPQIYGTQYRVRPGEPTTQEPYARALIGDDQRRALGVKTLAEQAEQAKAIEAERAASAPGK